jgi:PHD/YefM family antitoxin component YafN of YafNO toxin-antitoxin module
MCDVTAIRQKFVVDKKGRKTGVVIPLKRYRRLLEDLHDLSAIAERRAERPISFEELKRRFRRDGLI